jgi:hypothetical protein
MQSINLIFQITELFYFSSRCKLQHLVCDAAYIMRAFCALRLKESMLARRELPRSAAISKLVWRSTQRSCYASISRPQSPHPRPEGLWGKVRYRKDGQPRSRLAGAAFGAHSMVLSRSYSSLEMKAVLSCSTHLRFSQCLTLWTTVN